MLHSILIKSSFCKVNALALKCNILFLALLKNIINNCQTHGTFKVYPIWVNFSCGDLDSLAACQATASPPDPLHPPSVPLVDPPSVPLVDPPSVPLVDPPSVPPSKGGDQRMRELFVLK
jgi:hypothetical protein